VSFAEDVEKKAKPIRRAILKHPFVTGIGDGTLDVEKFKSTCGRTMFTS
jgi:thiaminase